MNDLNHININMARKQICEQNLYKRQKYRVKNDRDSAYLGISSTQEPSNSSASELYSPQGHNYENKTTEFLHPIPKGNSTYAKAKHAEYIDKDLKKAEEFLKKAIREGDRAESAAKDLAGLLHRQGRTDEACEMLKEYRLYFKDRFKYENLLNNLAKQIQHSGNSLNKWLKVSGLRPTDSSEAVCTIFQDSSRITSVEIGFEETYYGKNHFGIIKFNSHSAARRTMEGFNQWGRYKIEWVNVQGEIAGEVFHSKPDGRRDRRTFIHKLFWRDPEDRILTLPLDKHCTCISDNSTDNSDEEYSYTPELENLLGANLFQLVFEKIGGIDEYEY